MGGLKVGVEVLMKRVMQGRVLVLLHFRAAVGAGIRAVEGVIHASVVAASPQGTIRELGAVLLGAVELK